VALAPAYLETPEIIVALMLIAYQEIIAIPAQISARLSAADQGAPLLLIAAEPPSTAIHILPDYMPLPVQTDSWAQNAVLTLTATDLYAEQIILAHCR